MFFSFLLWALYRFLGEDVIQFDGCQQFSVRREKKKGKENEKVKCTFQVQITMNKAPK